MRGFAPFALLSAVLAQAPSPQLPKLLRVGRIPDAPTVTLASDSDGANVLRSLPAGTKEFALRADQSTPMAVVQRVLDAALARGVERVLLLAQSSDGKEGAFVLALPEAKDVATQLTMRAHRDRPGVRPECATPLLRRLVLGDLPRGYLVLRLVLPRDASHAQLLALLEAAEAADVRSVVVATEPAVGGKATAPLALDLDGPFLAQVPAREQRFERIGPQKEAIGFWLRAPAAGQRVDLLMASFPASTTDENVTDCLALARDWLVAQQQANGAFLGVDGRDDVEATAEVVAFLIAHGDLEHDAVRRAIGYLVANQRDDGSFVDRGPGSTRSHARATWATYVRCSFGPGHRLLGPSLQLATDYLISQQRADGGFGDGPADAPSDTISTAVAMCAIADPPQKPTRESLFASRDAAHAWLGARDEPDANAIAAELCARRSAGEHGSRRLEQLVTRIGIADAALDPLGRLHAGIGLSISPEAVKTWLKRLVENVPKQQVRDGRDAGSWSPPAGTSRVTATARTALALQQTQLGSYAPLLR